MYRLMKETHETVEGSLFRNVTKREYERFVTLEEAKEFYQRNRDRLIEDGSIYFIEKVEFVTYLE